VAKPQEHIPAAPLVKWLERELEREPDRKALAIRLGVDVRVLYRWQQSIDWNEEPCDSFPRPSVENALHRAGVLFGDVYPSFTEDVELEPDGFCSSCRDIVTPINGRCPWCERPTTADLPNRMFCPREDGMRFPALDGKCWRCGGKLQRQIPFTQCACGCDTSIPRFSLTSGKEVKWVRGHAPRSMEKNPLVPLEPLARWLEGELRALDPIQSLARRTGISRENLLDFLNRRVETVPIQEVRRAVFKAAHEGQGKGMPPRPGSVMTRDLYPDYVRSLTCSGCGGRKSAHAALCKKCYVHRGPKQLFRDKSLTPDLLEQAREIREREGIAFIAIAARIQPRTRCTNVESVKGMLLQEFKARGWDTSRKAAA
jgi:hypothetical protein